MSTPRDDAVAAALDVLAADGRFNTLMHTLRVLAGQPVPPAPTKSAPSVPPAPTKSATPAVPAPTKSATPPSNTKRRRAVTAYTDGACSGNPGRGGWGVAFDDGTEYSGGETDTTNNKMELQAAIVALERAPDDADLTVVTDSQYVKQGITLWIRKWRANGWKTTAGKPVKNQDLWQRLDELSGERSVVWEWVRGHAGNAGNERADALAVAAMPPAT